MQKVLHQVIETNQDDGDIQIKAVIQLETITNQLERYYMALPKVSQVESADVNTLFPSPSSPSPSNNNINDNNSTMIMMKHDPPSNDCKCPQCTDPQAKF